MWPNIHCDIEYCDIPDILTLGGGVTKVGVVVLTPPTLSLSPQSVLWMLWMFVRMVSLTTERGVTVALILTRILDVALTTNVVMELPVSSLETPPAGYHD